MKQYLMPAVVVVALVSSSLAFAQKPKTKKEIEALQAIQAATDDDTRIAAIENLLIKFADTEYKIVVLEAAMDSARHKGDLDTTDLYGERLLEADPNNLNALSTLAKDIADRTREFDLDKTDKLKRVDDLANKAIKVGATATKPSAQMTDEQWTQRKGFYMADSHAALGSAAGFLRVHLKKHLKMRSVPELHFLPDESIERAVRVSALINAAVASDAERADRAPGEPADGEDGDEPAP